MEGSFRIATWIPGQDNVLVSRVDPDGMAFYDRVFPIPHCPACQSEVVAWAGYYWRTQQLHWCCVTCNLHWVQHLDERGKK